MCLLFHCSIVQVRDYIHVVDLADGHLAALNKLSNSSIGLFSEIVICPLFLVSVSLDEKFQNPLAYRINFKRNRLVLELVVSV